MTLQLLQIKSKIAAKERKFRIPRGFIDIKENLFSEAYSIRDKKRHKYI